MKLLTYTFFSLSLCSFATETEKLNSTGNVKTTIQYRFHKQSIAQVIKVGTFAWTFNNTQKGKSNVITLYKHSQILRSTGQSYRKIIIQLPQELRVGQTVELKTAPLDRKGTKDSSSGGELALLREGEIVAMFFGNPRSGHLKDVEKAKIKILSINDKQVKIHLALKAKLVPRFKMDIDEEFILTVKSPEDNKRKQSNP